MPGLPRPLLVAAALLALACGERPTPTSTTATPKDSVAAPVATPPPPPTPPAPPTTPAAPTTPTVTATPKPHPDSAAAPTVFNPDWADASHGKLSAPNYAVAFPQEAVNTIEITLTATQWASVRANMTALYGYDFGARSNAGAGFPDEDPDYVDADVKFNGRVWKSVGFRLKGNSSLSSAWGQGNYKLPFRLKLNEFGEIYPAIANQRFYGFKELSMSPGWSDNSLIREKVAADVFRAAGVPAARTAFYRVFIDFGQGLKYCGVYTMVEVIDDTMVKDQFGEDKGNIYKPESRFATFVQDEFEKKNNKTGDYSDVQSAISALNSGLRTTNPARWRADLEKVFNVDHFVRWLAVNNAVVNWDSYGTMAHNHYLYNHSSRGPLWIPWDHNQSLTGSPGVTGTVSTAPGGMGAMGGGAPGGRQGLSLTMNEITSQWPLIRYVADDSVYFARYKTHLRAFRDTVFTTDRMNALIDKYSALISPYVVGANGEQTGYTYLPNQGAFAAGVATLKSHVQSRRALLATFLP